MPNTEQDPVAQPAVITATSVSPKKPSASPLDDDIFSDSDTPSPLAGLEEDASFGDDPEPAGELLGGDALADSDMDLVGDPLAEDTSDEEDTPAEDEGIGILHIYNSNCLKCTALVPEMEGEDGFKMFKKCHFEKGNEDCPARTVNIVKGVPVAKVVNRILEAEANSDTMALGQIYAKLSARDQSIQQMVSDALQEERKKRMRKSMERRASAQQAEEKDEADSG